MAERKLTPRGEFDKALAERAGRFGVVPDAEARGRLGEYFELVAAWSPRLHLVAPCAPAEFATRHVLESLTALPFIHAGATVLDVGSGAGLPAIPCLVARRDLKAVMVEASQRKAVFLREALSKLGMSERARVVADRFEKVEPPDAKYLTCRAIERFAEILPSLVEWSASVPTLLLFGGEGLRGPIENTEMLFDMYRVPESERRFLFVVHRP